MARVERFPMHYFLVLDEGTTSTRAMLFAPDGNCAATAQKPVTQHYPAAGRVEHDASEIWALTLACAQQMVTHAGGPENIISIGITNQRETIVFWDARTGEPLSPAIVWQDRRTSDICATLKDQGHETLFQSRTGLLLDPYFSGSKIGWALQHWPQLKACGEALRVGTIESYLVFRLSGGTHVSDASNASRTALMALETGAWDAEMCDLFGVPMKILPAIIDCAGLIAHTAGHIFGKPVLISGVAGDQQAALIGQACLSPGQTKATYGTGAFVLTQTGDTIPSSRNRLLATVAWQIGGKRNYALEGSVFVAGSLIQWLRDGLGLISASAETEAIAAHVADNGGVFIVPALTGLGAPHWRPDVRGLISGLGFSTNKSHIVRAALEAMAHQTHDLKAAFAADGADWAELHIDGGMSANTWMAQDLADILDVPVERPDFVETTALGAAMLAAVGAGVYATLAEAAVMRGGAARFTAAMPVSARQARLSGWANSLKRAL